MPFEHPYKPNRPEHPYQENPGGTPPHSAPDADLDAAVRDVVQAGSRFGSAVLGGLSGVIHKVGEALASRNLADKTVPFSTWKQRLDHKLKNDPEEDSLALSVIGWVLAAGLGIGTLASAIAAGVNGGEPGFIILMVCLAPAAAGCAILGWRCGCQYSLYRHLRSYLQFSHDWTAPVAELAAQTGQPQSLVQSELRKGIANGALPGVALSRDGETLYWDDARYTPPAAQDAPAGETAAPQSESEALRREGVDFLNYLRSCRGRLDESADEQLAAMQKVCGSILGFAHNHPEALPRLRRFRDYYLPTTRKLLDTALGLGDTGAAAAEQMRGEITGILHTLNTAYTKLYDTLLQDVRLDVSTEIDTLETMLRQDGLTHDFSQDFGPAPKQP